MTKPSTLFARSLFLLALLGGTALSTPGFAATATTPPTAAAQKTPTAEDAAQSKKMTPQERVEFRIKELYEKLKITDAQKEAWDKVAAQMRENEEQVHKLIQERRNRGEKRTAMEDLESYQKIAAAHAEGLSKFIPVFQALYDSMSPEQKANADTAFARFEGHRRHGPGEARPAGKTK